MSIVPAAANNPPDTGKIRIIVGGKIDYPPYSFLDKKGGPSGFQMDLTRAIAGVMGMDIEIRLTPRPDALRLLASGKGDYALVAQMPGYYWIRELKLLNIISVGANLEPFKNCFAVRKENTALLSRFTEGLNIIKQTGEYQKLYEKWLGVTLLFLCLQQNKKATKVVWFVVVLFLPDTDKHPAFITLLRWSMREGTVNV